MGEKAHRQCMNRGSVSIYTQSVCATLPGFESAKSTIGHFACMHLLPVAYLLLCTTFHSHSPTTIRRPHGNG